MAQDLNRFMAIGRLTEDPVVNSEKEVANFSIACNSSYKNSQNQIVEEVFFMRCVAWRGLSKVVGDYLKKGAKVYIDGRLSTEKWTDKNNQVQYTTKCRVETMNMLGDKRAEGSGSTPQGQSQGQGSSRSQSPSPVSAGGPDSQYDEMAPLDDIPF